MNSIEFTMTTDLVAATPRSIDFNYDELKAWLQENILIYKGVVVTTEQMKESKDLKSRIKKVADTINRQRIDAKNAYMAPYNDFKDRCDELTAMCNEVSWAIDTQIKAIEETEKAQKIKELQMYFAEVAAPVFNYLRFDEVSNPRWRNKGYAIEDAKKEIDAAVAKTQEDVATIKAMQSKYEPALLDMYRQAKDIGMVVRKNAEFIAEDDRKEAYRKAQEEAEEATVPVETKDTAEETRIQQSTTKQPVGVYKNDDVLSCTLTVFGTREALWGLRRYMDENNIQFFKT